ncbi:hypothetical protein HPB50_017333 [Hyalomma asiaticum]|uniref:Uncharacterized protein n=1 Tax=Hyalomma asiaticum TaxID=266040 RepID=A0ACB7S3X2_HYAAI|nr:hypothetical protein HPB50_017333 [Hyalomma asiaticum]
MADEETPAPKKRALSSKVRAQGKESSWSNSNIDFGSDHYILMITLVVANKKERTFRVVDWDTFRTRRAQRIGDEERDDPGTVD